MLRLLGNPSQVLLQLLDAPLLLRGLLAGAAEPGVEPRSDCRKLGLELTQTPLPLRQRVMGPTELSLQLTDPPLLLLSQVSGGAQGRLRLRAVGLQLGLQSCRRGNARLRGLRRRQAGLELGAQRLQLRAGLGALPRQCLFGDGGPLLLGNPALAQGPLGPGSGVEQLPAAHALGQQGLALLPRTGQAILSRLQTGLQLEVALPGGGRPLLLRREERRPLVGRTPGFVEEQAQVLPLPQQLQTLLPRSGQACLSRRQLRQQVRQLQPPCCACLAHQPQLVAEPFALTEHREALLRPPLGPRTLVVEPSGEPLLRLLRLQQVGARLVPRGAGGGERLVAGGEVRLKGRHLTSSSLGVGGGGQGGL